MPPIKYSTYGTYLLPAQSSTLVAQTQWDLGSLSISSVYRRVTLPAQFCLSTHQYSTINGGIYTGLYVASVDLHT